MTKTERAWDRITDGIAESIRQLRIHYRPAVVDLREYSPYDPNMGGDICTALHHRANDFQSGKEHTCQCQDCHYYRTLDPKVDWGRIIEERNRK